MTPAPSHSYLEAGPVCWRQVIDGVRGAGLDDAIVIVGGIIPDADADYLRSRGVADVFTPKDYDATAIMSRVVDLLRAERGLAPIG